jgi:hypothetical protein
VRVVFNESIDRVSMIRVPCCEIFYNRVLLQYALDMLKEIHSLIIGVILLTIAFLAYITGNLVVAFLFLPVALIFFVRQLVALRPKKPDEPTDTPINNQWC